jgi:hypothetical protein
VSYELCAEEKEAAEQILTGLAPDELPLLKQLMRRPTWRDRFQGKAVGYGVDSAVTVVAPYVLLTVVWAKSIVENEAKSILGPRLRALTRRVLGVKDSEINPPDPPIEVNPEELVKAVTEFAIDLGLKKAKAEVLASAVVGRVLPAKGST